MRSHDEYIRQELVAFMSLKTMFPDPLTRELADAAGDGDLDEIDELVARGADVNARGRRNATPLFWALKRSSIKGFKKLLELGADPNVVYDDGGSVMHWAVDHDDVAFLKAALAHGGNPNLKAGPFNAPLLFDAIHRDGGQLDLLLAAGADMEARDDVGFTAVRNAVGHAQFDVVMKLLERGADYRSKSPKGTTLAEYIAWKRGTLNRNHEQYRLMLKVVAWLEQRGVVVPAE